MKFIDEEIYLDFTERINKETPKEIKYDYNLEKEWEELDFKNYKYITKEVKTSNNGIKALFYRIKKDKEDKEWEM